MNQIRMAECPSPHADLTPPPLAMPPRILIVDDTRSIHEDFRKTLAPPPPPPELDLDLAQLLGSSPAPTPRCEFLLDSAHQGAEALTLVQQALREDRPFSVAFLDVHMPPGWDGIETAIRLWEADPELQIVFCTAYSSYAWEEMVKLRGAAGNLLILKKPFEAIEVLQLAHTLTKKWQVARQTKTHMAGLTGLVQERNSELTLANAQLRQAQKMEAIGQLAGGVAHDFNNLLAVIRGNAELVLMHTPQLAGPAADCLRQVLAAADRAAGLTRQLLLFSRKRVLQIQVLGINEVVENLTKMLRRIIGEHIELQYLPGANLPSIEADPGMLEQVLVNLVVNARDAMPNGGLLTITTNVVDLEPGRAGAHPESRPGRFVRLRVSDNGTGIAPEHLPHLFEPFFTTKEAGKGTGLGLATVRGIVNQHHGWVEVQSAAGAGAAFFVFLPAVQPASADTTAPAPSEAEPKRGSETILLVEDDDAVRNLTRRLLENFGYRVHEATCGREALTAWSGRLSEIDLLLTDMVMPQGVSGQELASRFQELRPQLKVVFISGYRGGLLKSDTDFIERTRTNFLQKPFDWRELATTVRRCLDDKFTTALTGPQPSNGHPGDPA